MFSNTQNQAIIKDEYTQKAQGLYAVLNISKDDYWTVEEIAQEYEEMIQSAQKKNIEDSTFYINR